MFGFTNEISAINCSHFAIRAQSEEAIKNIKMFIQSMQKSFMTNLVAWWPGTDRRVHACDGCQQNGTSNIPNMHVLDLNFLELNLNPDSGRSVFHLQSFLSPVWVFSGYSDILPWSKNTQVWLTGLSICVNVIVHFHCFVCESVMDWHCPGSTAALS